jgi:hypothetical protein
MADEEKTAAIASEPTYTREALAGSKKYREQCDIIMIALDPDREYTLKEADAKIKTLFSKPIKEKINGKE